MQYTVGKILRALQLPNYDILKDRWRRWVTAHAHCPSVTVAPPSLSVPIVHPGANCGGKSVRTAQLNNLSVSKVATRHDCGVSFEVATRSRPKKRHGMDDEQPKTL